VSENPSFEGQYTTTKAVLSARPVYITLAISIPFYGLILTLDWPGIELLLFPIFSTAATLFFAILFGLKTQTYIPNAIIRPHLLGNEKIIWQTFLGSTICQLALLGFLGLDSRAHPQLMDNYGILYFIPLILFYSLSWFLIPWAIWSHVKIDLRYQEKNSENIEEMHYRKVCGIKPETVKQTATTSLILFIMILGICIVDSLIVFNGESGFWPYTIYLPADPHGNPQDPIPLLPLSGSYVLILYILPIMIIKQVTKITDDLRAVPEQLPKMLQEKGYITSNHDLIEVEMQINQLKLG
jgi:hypothetical protein